MPNAARLYLLLPAIAAISVSVASGVVLAQTKKGGGIVCWKDKSGKTVGCGDKVPPEYQDNEARVLDKTGVTRKTLESAEEREKRLAQEKIAEKEKAEAAKKAAEQKRQDTALLNTYTSEKEIDLRRDRDLATIDGQITQMRVMHKNAASRAAEVKDRIAGTTKSGKPASDAQKNDLQRAEADMRRHESTIADKEKEKEEIRARYAAMRARFTELKGGGSAAPAPAATAKK